MVRTTVSALALCSIGGAALAGGVERSSQPVGILFEEGNYVQLGFTYVSPDVSGTVGGGTVSSGDMAPSYTNFSLAYKQQINDRLDLALIIDQPNGADVDYANVDPGYPFVDGTTAELDGYEVSALLKYRFDNGVSIYGGPRIQSLTAELNDLQIGGPGYDLEVDRTYELGYAAGVAYERKDIALRVALTYRSAIDHDFDSTEDFGAGGVAGNFTTTIPQSLNLEFQTGVAEDTLLFGSVRWQDWSEFDITPPNLGSALIDYDSDYITYNLGVGRRFNENWSGAVSIGYEGESGDLQGNLAPRDGFASIGVGATYTKGNMKVTGGVRYIALGGATTTTIGADFDNNDAWAAGIQVGFQL